jgi:probable HAF family extracellular repeat protein
MQLKKPLVFRTLGCAHDRTATFGIEVKGCALSSTRQTPLREAPMHRTSQTRTQILSLVVVVLAAPLTLIAGHSPTHPRYKVIDLGTLGGPLSYGPANEVVGGRLLNDRGGVTSYADTRDPDPFAPNFCFVPDCLVAHSYRWRQGVITDLGALANGYSSFAASINDRGWSVGESQTGILDPVSGFPQIRAVLWTGHRMIDLGTVPGGSASIGMSINNAGQAVGVSDNGVPDPFSPFGVQVRTFFWEHGQLQDIGTLGGPDTTPGPGCNNQRPGVIVGSSYTSFTPNDTTGVPTQDPFLWDNGHMIDLGNLGGTKSIGQCANNRGDVIGQSNLPGDLGAHAFIWHSAKMKDLGTLGGNSSEAIWMNDAGDIAGSADLPTPGIHDAVRWRNGHILDLGTVAGDPCSRGRAINSRGQIVGGSSDCRNFLHAFIWEDGGPMLDLNTLIPSDSGLQLTNAFNINDRGQILAKSVPSGVTPIEDEDLGHVVLLIPCEADDDCTSDAPPMMSLGAIGRAVSNLVAAETDPQRPPNLRDAIVARPQTMARQYRLAPVAPAK